nr:protease inhibitor I42 family protein [Tumebacillus permanentifrigoris]
MTVGPEVNGHTFTLQEQEQLQILLPANPTTGYRWVEVQTGNLRLDQTGFVPGGRPGIYGSGGLQEWVFTAIHPGQSEILMRYQRPWDDSTVHDTFRLTVHVKKT